MPDRIDYAVTFGFALLILSGIAALPFLILWRLPDWHVLAAIVLIAALWTKRSMTWENRRAPIEQPPHTKGEGHGS